MAAGDFTASALLRSQLMADQIWKDNQTNADYVAKVEIAKALRMEQTADVRLLEESDKDREVRITWLKSCVADAVESTDDCVIDGVEMEVDKRDYALTICKESTLKIREKVFRTNDYTFEQAVAKGILAHTKVLDEAIAKAAVGFLEANEGTPTYNADGAWTISGSETNIPAAVWTEDIFADFLLEAELQKFSNPFLLTGRNLWKEQWKADREAGNGEGKGGVAKFASMRTHFDVHNIDTVNAPNRKTYLIDRGAVALATKSYYGASPVDYIGAGQQRYSIDSRALDGVRYDVVYTNECVGNDIFHKWRFQTKFGWLLNPIGCTATKTGILTKKRV